MAQRGCDDVIGPGAPSGSPGADEAPAVALDGLTKHYDRVEALHEVSLSVGRSRFLVLLGPSGSGKSTLIRCLAGIERPTAGEIRIAGEVVAGRRRSVPPERRDLAMVFQDFALWPHMTVTENVTFALRRRRPAKAQAAATAHSMLDRVGLAHHAGRYPHELSGGEQQRVALARALVAKPTLLLFDEPLSSLDANLRERLRIEIGTLVREQGATAVYITHDQGEAFALGDEIGVLQSGRLVQHGAPEVIYRTPATPFVARFTGLAGVLPGRLLGSAPSRSAGGLDQAAGAGGRVRAAQAGEQVRVALATTNPTLQADIQATPMGPLSPGAAVQVMLRPTAARICNPHARAATLRAVIRDGAYHGRGYDYVLTVGEGVDLTGIFDRRRFAVGETVGVHLDPTRALAFAADPAINLAPLSADALARDAPDRLGAPDRDWPPRTAELAPIDGSS